jgi:hypothetical protein
METFVAILGWGIFMAVGIFYGTSLLLELIDIATETVEKRLSKRRPLPIDKGIEDKERRQEE